MASSKVIPRGSRRFGRGSRGKGQGEDQPVGLAGGFLFPFPPFFFKGKFQGKGEIG